MPSASGARCRHSGFSAPRRQKKHQRSSRHESPGERAGQQSGRQMPRPRARIARVDIGVHQAVERHGGRPRAHHRDHDPQDLPAETSGTANPIFAKASSAPVSANGRAKTECSNLIMSSVSRSLRQKPLLGGHDRY